MKITVINGSPKGNKLSVTMQHIKYLEDNFKEHDFDMLPIASTIDNIYVNSEYFDWTPFVAPDESYLIFSSTRPGSKDKYGDLYVSFKDKNNNWMPPINMGDKVNTEKQERFPGISKNGKILFFTRGTEENFDDIFWINSSIINELKDNCIANGVCK